MKNPRSTKTVQAMFNEAVSLHQKGHFEQAFLQYNQIIQKNSKHSDALHMMGVLVAQQGRISEGLDLINKSLVINPKSAQAYNNSGILLRDLGFFEEALKRFDSALKIQPNYPEASNNQGVSLQQLGRLSDALESFRKVISVSPKFTDAYYNLGNTYRLLGDLKRAITCYEDALNLQSNFVDAYNNLGLTLRELGRLEEAEIKFRCAINHSPNYVSAINNLGITLRDLGKNQESLECYDKALLINPTYADAHNNRSLILRDLHRPDEALVSVDIALRIRPDYSDALNNKGLLLKGLGRIEEAIISFEEALRIDPNCAGVYNNRGNAFRKIKRFAEAIESYRKAIEINPFFEDAYNNKGAVLHELGLLHDAISEYKTAIAVNPNYVDAFYNLGNAYRDLGQWAEAHDCYDKALCLKPDYDFLPGILLYAKMQLSFWDSYNIDVCFIEKSLSELKRVVPPFQLLSFSDDQYLQYLAAKIWTDTLFPGIKIHSRDEPLVNGCKIKVGYFSPDFRNHPVSFLIADLMKSHDRNLIEVYCFSYGAPSNDPIRHKIVDTCDHFFDVFDQSDQSIIKLSREIGIDIAVDLAGFTQGSRTEIFAARVAPVQVSYLGYIGTMGNSYTDYIISDRIVIPESSRVHYTEKTINLPFSYQVNGQDRAVSERMFTRQDFGLPSKGFIYCCFNNTYKINPFTFDSWMRILNEVPGSVLWLITNNETVKNNLRKEAEIRGVDGGRLIFTKRIQLDEYMASYKLADIFLDTFPYNAGTTASDALWMGVPVLTLKGNSFVSRMAASLLNAVGLIELVAESRDEFVHKAIELGIDANKYGRLKIKLDHNKHIMPLFDITNFAKGIDAAFKEIHRRRIFSEPPTHLDV